jgi:photosystem II stability/assembly factor-like uncharacterized protein
MAVAAVVLVAVAVSYLRPGAATHPAATPAATPQPVTDPIGLSFGDARHGAVTLIDRSPYPAAQAAPPTAWLTADGGRTWRRYAAATTGLPIVRFDAPLHAVAAADVGTTTAFEVTDDGGRTWHPLVLPGGGVGTIGLPTFLDTEHGWWVQGLGSDGIGGPRPVALWRTNDRGGKWERLDASGVPAAGGQIGLRFLDPRHGVMVVNSPPNSSLLVTDDGGETWRAASSFDSPGLGIKEPAWASVYVHGRRMTAVVTGATAPVSSLVSFSDDDGQTWSRPLPTPFVLRGARGLPGPVMDERGRLVALDDRTLWSSPDNGITWRSRIAVLPGGLRAIDAIVAAAGALYVPATDGMGVRVLRSLDGGVHWTELRLPVQHAPTAA